MIRILRVFLTMTLTVAAAGFCAATLIRIAPGYGADERALDTRLSDAGFRAVQERAGADRSLPAFYGHYLGRLLRGDLGDSQAFGRPVAELLAERIPASLKVVAWGLAAGWVSGLTLSLWATAVRRSLAGRVGEAASAVLLCVPAPALALLFVLASRSVGNTGRATAGALALAIFPRVFRYSRGILAEMASAPHVMMARARGLSEARLLAAHVLAPSSASLLAVMGISVSIAFGAAIPIEVVCDYAGIGQLAWKAALQRDLPLLVGITLFASVVASAANSIAEAARA